MKKLALLAAAIIVVALIVHQWNGHTAATAPAPADTRSSAATPAPAASPPATPTAESTPTVSGGPYGGTDAARKAWEPIVQGFALAYPDTDTLTKKQWLAGLRPYLDKDVIDALADTDLDQVPAGHYAGYQTLKIADEAITVRITYQEGWALVLYVAADGGNTWSISSLDIDAGSD